MKARNAQTTSLRKWQARAGDFASHLANASTDGYSTLSVQPAQLTSNMTDTPKDAPPLKKRSLFKRAAWQDSPTNDEDIFSHSKDFKHIVAQQKRYEAEKKEAERKKKAEEGRERKRKLAATGDRKRNKVSHDNESVLAGSASGSSPQANETCSKAYAAENLTSPLSRPADSITDVARPLSHQ
jgi:hypothetical protein